MDSDFPDVSYYQGVINWQTMAAKTCNVTIRGAFGVSPDTQFTNNWNGAKRYGIQRGVYTFAVKGQSPVSQANTICGLIRNDLPELRVWVDWEKDLNGNLCPLSDVVAVMRQIETNLPSVTVGMYTGYYVMHDNSNAQTNHAEYSYLADKPLWIADYDSLPQIPAPWVWPPELHQYGTPVIGIEYGCASKELDMNTVYSNHSVYGLEGNGGTVDPITKAWYLVTAQDGLNVRNAPGGSIIGALKYQSKVLVDGTQPSGNTLWSHFIDAKDPTGNPVSIGGVPVSQRSDCWSSSQFLAKTDDPVDPEPEPMPPQDVTIIDDKGIKWQATGFRKL